MFRISKYLPIFQRLFVFSRKKSHHFKILFTDLTNIHVLKKVHGFRKIFVFFIFFEIMINIFVFKNCPQNLINIRHLKKCSQFLVKCSKFCYHFLNLSLLCVNKIYVLVSDQKQLIGRVASSTHSRL